MISGRLAKELGIKKNDVPISLNNPIFNVPPFQAKTASSPIHVEHELLPGGFGFIFPIIEDDLHWDIILGGDSMMPLFSALFNPAMRMAPTEGYLSFNPCHIPSSYPLSSQHPLSHLI